MIDDDFCGTLEYALCRALAASDDVHTAGFWCDGVALNQPADRYSRKFVNDERAVTLRAYLGRDGQGEYQLTLRFGRRALSRYARDLDIRECIPRQDTPPWFTVDTKRNEVEVVLE